MTKQQRHLGLPVISAVCLAVAAFAAVAAGGAEQHSQPPTIRAQNPAAFGMADYHHWRENIAPGNGEFAASPAGVSADNAKPTNDFRPIANVANVANVVPGIDDLRALAIDAVNDNNGGFAKWRKQAQMRMFASLEDDLARRGERALSQTFTALKRSQVDFQTELAGRKSNIGVNLIGVFGEQQNAAVGWQLRAYGGQESSKGINAGVFYRRITGEMLWGGNLFADFEDHEYGTFIRYSIGGDFQHRFVFLAANYYVPTTGNLNIGKGLVAFSRQGYDIRARIVIPKTHIRAAFDYYDFDGENFEPSDKGFRYGVEAHHFPVAGLRFGLFYDDEGGQLGSEFSYTHTFGGEAKMPNSEGVPPPDLFAPVGREHSQRIATTPAEPVTLLNRAIAMDRFLPMTVIIENGATINYATVAVVTLTAAGGGNDYVYRVNSARPYFDTGHCSGRGSCVVRATLPPLQQRATVTATAVIADGDNRTDNFLRVFTVSLELVTVPGISASIVWDSGVRFFTVTTNAEGNTIIDQQNVRHIVATLSASGGAGNLSYHWVFRTDRTQSGGVALMGIAPVSCPLPAALDNTCRDFHVRSLLTSRVLTATVVVTDNDHRTQSFTLFFTVSSTVIAQMPPSAMTDSPMESAFDIAKSAFAFLTGKPAAEVKPPQAKLSQAELSKGGHFPPPPTNDKSGNFPPPLSGFRQTG